MKITGAQLFVKALQNEQIDTLFAYPGGQAIDLFDALYDAEGIEVILPRHEQGLIHAADGYARTSGRVGVCLVTSGPGAANLVTGIATANYDSVPLVCFTGQVPTSLMGKESFQEADIVSITKSICKWSVTIHRREDLGAVIKTAFHTAQSGKPGVVVVDIPKDIQQERGSDGYPDISELSVRHASTGYAAQLSKAAEALRGAKRPLLLAGGGVHIADGGALLEQFVQQSGIPVVSTIMGKGALPTSHPLYIGNIGIHGSYAANLAIRCCDVLLAIGTRFNDRITGKTDEFAQNAVLIHADIEPSVISRTVPADIPICADAKKILTDLCTETAPADNTAWHQQVEGWKDQYPLPVSNNSLSPRLILESVNRLFDDAVIVTDVGQNQLWATQFLELNRQKKLLTSGGFGTMGYGLPAALGAKLANPDRDVIAITGDGGMQMNIQELATAVVYELPVIICIFNNGCLGNVRQWQEMFFHKRYSSTCTRYRRSCPEVCTTASQQCPEYVPDFIQVAQGYGANALRVTSADAVEAALTQAKNTAKIPTVIEFIIDREENVLPIVLPGKPLEETIF